MALQLIINSDDYGRSAEISRGIRQAHSHGVVTSTTCMMNFPTTADDIAIALRETPNLGMGVHLVLTAGRPLLPAAELSTLTDADGNFLKLASFVAQLPLINTREAKAEWRAQIETFIQATGRTPTHLDSHHHASYCTEGLFRAMLELAREYDCAIRLASVQGDGSLTGLPVETHQLIREYGPRLTAEFAPRHPDAFHATFYDERATREELLRLIQTLPEHGLFEIMCHPGYADPDLTSIYAHQREVELDVLTDDAVKEAILARGIELVTFAGQAVPVSTRP